MWLGSFVGVSSGCKPWFGFSKWRDWLSYSLHSLFLQYSNSTWHLHIGGHRHLLLQPSYIYVTKTHLHGKYILLLYYSFLWIFLSWEILKVQVVTFIPHWSENWRSIKSASCTVCMTLQLKLISYCPHLLNIWPIFPCSLPLMATDTENIKVVFCAVKDTIMQKALAEMGFA